MSTIAPRLSAFFRFTAAGCALVVFLLGVLALSPALHGELHDDCCAPEHECVITLFHAGVENPTAHVLVTIAPPHVRIERLAAPVTERVREAAPERLPPSQGPPNC